MKRHFIKFSLFALVTAAVIAAPALSRADDTSTNAPAMTPAPKHGKHGAPFHGTLDAVDANAMTLTVGSRTFQITSNTKITKNGQPAILSDGVVGQPVSGYYKTDEDGNLNAVTVHFGARTRKHKESPGSNMSTNNPDSNTSTNSPGGN